MPGTWRQATCYQVTRFFKVPACLSYCHGVALYIDIVCMCDDFCWFLSLLLVQRAQLGQAGISFFGNPHQKYLPPHSIRKYKYRDANANHHHYNIFHLTSHLTPSILTCHPCCGCLGGFVVVGYPEPKKEVFKLSFDQIKPLLFI